MNRELSEIEVEAQLRQKMVEQLLPFGVQFPATRRDQRRYVSDEDLVAAVLKVYIVRKRPADPMVLYRHALAGIYAIRPSKPEPKEPPQVAPPREGWDLSNRNPVTYDAFMRFNLERAQHAQPRIDAMTSNVKPSTMDGRHQGLA